LVALFGLILRWSLIGSRKEHKVMGTRQSTARLISETNGFPNGRAYSGNLDAPGSDPPTPDPGVERHYSVGELARLWSLSEKTIRRIFENEPGVLQWGSQETRFKRGYTTLRIPESVMLRVHRRLRIAG
jgi:hypothetical protein